MKKIIALGVAAMVGSASAQSFGNMEVGVVGGLAGSGFGADVFVQTLISGDLGAKATVGFSNGAGAISGQEDNGSGRAITIGLDATYDLQGLGLDANAAGVEANIYGGARYGMFRVNYNSLKGEANAFGLGAGVQAAYPIAENVSLVGDLGFDYYLSGNAKVTIDGTVVGEDSGTYEDLDAVFKAKVGAKIKL